MSEARDRVELSARESYGRLLAWLTSRSGSIAAAEDALGDALVSALASWPNDGVPTNPEAWLLTVARRRMIDQRRRESVRQGAEADLSLAERLRLHREAAEAFDVPFRSTPPERRLELMFMCAHPEIPAAMRTPLMLQAVLGLTAQEIASALLAVPATIGQRLVRVKRHIVERKIPFELPSRTSLPERLGHVLDAVYAAYGTGWNAAPELCGAKSGLRGEALYLASQLVRLMPHATEAKGLYALLCLCESRRPAQRDAEGGYVPLDQQDTTLWDPDLILEGEKALWLAARAREPGPYQTEAAIHSVHAHRARSGGVDWQGIFHLYEVLVSLYPSLGARIGHAAALGRIGKAEEGLAKLEELDAATVERHQPYWAVRAWLLERRDQFDAAQRAYERAIGLSEDPAVRAWLAKQRERLDPVTSAPPKRER